MNRIEQAFKANDETFKQKSEVIVEAEVHQETAADEYTYTYNTEGTEQTQGTEGDYTENTYTEDDLSPRDDQSAENPPDIPEKDYH